MSARRHVQRGVAAVELALILVLSFGLLPTMLLFGRIYWNFSVMQDACGAAAHYMASSPLVTMGEVLQEQAIEAQAKQIVYRAASSANVGTSPPYVSIACSSGQCKGISGGTVTVTAYFDVMESELDGFLQSVLPANQNGWTLHVSATVPYANHLPAK